MAGGTNLYSWAARAVREGISTRQTLRDLRNAGFAVTDKTFYKLVSSVRSDFETRKTVADAPLDRKPRGTEILPFASLKESGYLQQVDVWVYNKNLGISYPRAYSIRTDTLLTHGDAIETAMGVMEDHAQDYDETVLGASYIGTYLLGQQL